MMEAYPTKKSNVCIELLSLECSPVYQGMEVARGEDTLHLNCSIPSRLFNYVFSAVCCGKIRYVHIFGTKLKWQKGKIFDATFSTIRDE